MMSNVPIYTKTTKQTHSICYLAVELEVVNQQACLEGRLVPKDEPNRKLTGAKQSKSNYTATNVTAPLVTTFLS